jgi:peptide/nickel transport system permease protein
VNRFVARRLLLSVPTLLGAVTVVFVLMRVVPGDPAVAILGEQASPQAIAELRRQLGLNDPPPVQYARFLGGALQGDLGRSFSRNSPVLREVFGAFPATVELSAAALAIALVVGLTAGVVAAVRPYSAWDVATTFGALVGVSMPVFWLGLLLIYLFAVQLRWVPVSGRVDVTLGFAPRSGFLTVESLLAGRWDVFASALGHLVLPAVALSTIPAAYVARITRSSMLEVVRRDYVRTARAKGLAERAVLLRHTLKNALIPIITVVGLQVGHLLGGAVLTETIFSWPGVGKLMVDAVGARDLPLVQGAVLVATAVFVLVNLAVDLLYAYVDPRIRYG